MRDRPLSSLCVLFAAIAAAYANSLGGAFQFDDYSVIVESDSVHSFSAWVADHGIRPVLKLSYLLNWTSGMGSVGFHLVNVGIHTANTFLVYCLARRLSASWEVAQRPGFSKHFALIAALAFAVHPTQTEAVTYISGRSTSLMAMFYLASLLTYARGRESGSGVAIYLLSPALLVMALLTKETAVTLPLALLLWDAAADRKLERSMLARQSVHWILLGAGAIALVAHPIYARLMAVSFNTRSLSENLANQANAVVYLISQMLWPVHLNIDPDLPSAGLWTADAIAKAAFLSAVAAVAIVLICKRSAFGVAIAWFFVHLAPTNSIVPRLDVVNDRQLYLAGIGFDLMFAAGLWHLRMSWRLRRLAAPLAAASFVLGLTGMTAMRNRDYLSEVALWESTVRSAPAKARPHHNLGCAYALAGRYEAAQRELTAALQLQPDYALARSNLATVQKLAAR